MIGTCSYCGRQSQLIKSLCIGHWAQQNRGEQIRPLRIRASNGKRTSCSVPGCEQRRSSKEGYCSAHIRQFRRTGRIGPLQPKGNGHVNKWGYRLIARPGHPNAFANGKILEHRWVMADYLGRALLADENVHHRNGDRLDNRIENLELWSTSQPSGGRVVDKIAWATWFLERYGHVVQRK